MTDFRDNPNVNKINILYSEDVDYYLEGFNDAPQGMQMGAHLTWVNDDDKQRFLQGLAERKLHFCGFKLEEKEMIMIISLDVNDIRNVALESIRIIDERVKEINKQRKRGKVYGKRK